MFGLLGVSLGCRKVYIGLLLLFILLTKYLWDVDYLGGWRDCVTDLVISNTITY